MGEILVADIEANGFKPNRIWMIGLLNVDTNEYASYVGDDEIPLGLMRLAEADMVIGHCFRTYDAPVIKNLTEGMIDIPKSRILDTCDMSRSLFPEMPDHKLASWGEIFEDHKIKYDKGFDKFHPDMVPYLEQDVRLNARLYRFFMDHINSLESKDT